MKEDIWRAKVQFRGILIAYVFCISSNSKAKMEFETKVVACEDIQEIKKSRAHLLSSNVSASSVIS